MAYQTQIEENILKIEKMLLTEFKLTQETIMEIFEEYIIKNQLMVVIDQNDITHMNKLGSELYFRIDLLNEEDLKSLLIPWLTKFFNEN